MVIFVVPCGMSINLNPEVKISRAKFLKFLLLWFSGGRNFLVMLLHRVALLLHTSEKRSVFEKNS